MPYFKCIGCHHEFETLDKKPLCDWCGAPSYILEYETPLEKMCDDMLNKGVGNWFKKHELDKLK